MPKFFLIIAFVCSVFSYSHAEVIAKNYQFGSIEFLIEQEIGRIVLPQIYKNVSLNINITPLPANCAQQLARLGKNDGEIMRIWTYGVENKEMLRVLTPYYDLETMPFVLKSSGIKITTKADLSRYRIVRVRGVKHTKNITSDIPNVHIVPSTEKMFELLLSGKVDVALTNTLDGLSIIDKMSAQGISPMSQPLAKLALYHYLHKKNKALLPIINKEIKQMKNTGALQKLIKSAEMTLLN